MFVDANSHQFYFYTKTGMAFIFFIGSYHGSVYESIERESYTARGNAGPLAF